MKRNTTFAYWIEGRRNMGRSEGVAAEETVPSSSLARRSKFLLRFPGSASLSGVIKHASGMAMISLACCRRPITPAQARKQLAELLKAAGIDRGWP
jgi:hypothetical protein